MGAGSGEGCYTSHGYDWIRRFWRQGAESHLRQRCVAPPLEDPQDSIVKDIITQGKSIENTSL